MKSFTVKDFARAYILLFLGLYAVMAFGRLYEIGTLAVYHGLDRVGFGYIAGALFCDLHWSLIGALLLWPPQALASRYFPAKQTVITASLITVLGMSNILLISYFGATLTPLGPEFWAYSLREMSNTVVASERITLWSLLLLSGLTATFFLIARAILNTKTDSLKALNPTWVLPLAGFFILLPATVITPGSQASGPDYQSNKLAYFISSGFQGMTGGTDTDYSTIEQEYPFLHEAADQSSLSPFFKDFNQPPDIVFLIVESLGGEFLGGGQWAGFAPNLDSLSRSGLYWENGLSLSGRTFGMMPSIFGSLPPGPNGFMELGPAYPVHQSLISLLDERGYHTSFFSGFNTYFDKLDFFLEYQGIDFVLNEQKIRQNFASKVEETNENYWGYDDKTMLDIASSILDTLRSFPRLEIYHTLQSHSPFTIPNPQYYEDTFDNLISRKQVSNSRKEAFRQYRAELTTLLYADEAVGDFMKAYSNRPRYKNTIFVITGDHWLIPVPMSSRISRYHVPIIIHSPLLKQPVHFKSVNTHADLTPTLISLLEQKTTLAFPDSVHWIGSSMDTARTFRNIHSIPLMRNKNQLSDYLHEEFYLSGDRFYRLEEDLALSETENEEIRNRLQKKLSQFKLKNRYVIDQNKLYPDGASAPRSGLHAFLMVHDTLFNRLDSLGMNTDEQFQEARRLAFNGYYDRARAVAKRLLLQHPEYYDVQLLVGRTHAWQGNFEQARDAFNRVLQQDSTYYDAYNALFDVEYWDGNMAAALDIIKKGLRHHPQHEQFLEKKIRALVALDRIKEAQHVYNKLQEQYPNSAKLKELDSMFTN